MSEFISCDQYQQRTAGDPISKVYRVLPSVFHFHLRHKGKKLGPFQSCNLQLPYEIEIRITYLAVQGGPSSETVRVGIYKTAHMIICPKFLSKRK